MFMYVYVCLSFLFVCVCLWVRWILQYLSNFLSKNFIKQKIKKMNCCGGGEAPQNAPNIVGKTGQSKTLPYKYLFVSVEICFLNFIFLKSEKFSKKKKENPLIISISIHFNIIFHSHFGNTPKKNPKFFSNSISRYF